MVVAQIGMGQHIIADPLARSQAAAMADHQPRLRSYDREVIGDGLGIGRANADVNQCDAGAVGRDQVIGRHLVPPPRAVGDEFFGIVARFDHNAACARHRRIARFGTKLFACPADEFIDIAVVIGEQHITLHMFRRCAGIVPQPRQAEIGAQPIEQRERSHIARRAGLAIGNLVADMRQLGRREMPREIQRRHLIELERVARIEHIGKGNFLPPSHDRGGDVIILQQQRQLLGQVIGKDGGLGHANRIVAGRYQPSERSNRRGAALAPAIVEPDFGISERPVVPHRRIGQGAVGEISGERGLKPGDGGGIKLVEFDHDLSGCRHRIGLGQQCDAGKTGTVEGGDACGKARASPRAPRLRLSLKAGRACARRC